VRIQLRRGLDANRINFLLASGEPGWTTDTKKLYIGDGVTFGGIEVGGAGSGGGLASLLNAFYNPTFRIAQRGIFRSSLALNDYIADRWSKRVTGVSSPDIGAHSTLNGNAALEALGINFMVRININSIGAAGIGNSTYFSQVVDFFEFPELQGKPSTFSIWIRNEHATIAQPLAIRLEDGTTTSTLEILAPAVGSLPGAAFTRYSVTLPNVAGEMRAQVFLAGGTNDGFSANFSPAATGNISLAGAQLSATNAPIAFVHPRSPIEERQRCLAFYQKSYRSNITAGGPAATDMNTPDGQVWRNVHNDGGLAVFRGLSINFPVQFRNTPGVQVYDKLGQAGRVDGYLDAFTYQGSMVTNFRGTSDKGAIFTPINGLGLPVNGIGFHWVAEYSPDF